MVHPALVVGRRRAHVELAAGGGAGRRQDDDTTVAVVARAGRQRQEPGPLHVQAVHGVERHVVTGGGGQMAGARLAAVVGVPQVEAANAGRLRHRHAVVSAVGYQSDATLLKTGGALEFLYFVFL